MFSDSGQAANLPWSQPEVVQDGSLLGSSPLRLEKRGGVGLTLVQLACRWYARRSLRNRRDEP